MSSVMIVFYRVAVGLLLFAMLGGLIRSIIGPTRADRILGVNLIGSVSTCILAILAIVLNEPWLLDVCLVYSMISFMTVAILAKIHLSNAKDSKTEDNKQGATDEEENLYE